MSFMPKSLHLSRQDFSWAFFILSLVGQAQRCFTTRRSWFSPVRWQTGRVSGTVELREI
jgi:hypothetical protein